MKKPRNIDIARMAGVSSATVSRVINKTCAVNEETYKKVIKAMDALGCEDRLKGALPARENPKERESRKIVIMCVPSISNPFYDMIASGIQAAANHFGYELMIYSQMLNGQRLNVLIDIARSNRVAGVITLEPLSREELERLCAATRVVQCCEYCEDSNVSYVSVDDRLATRTALEYLKSCGCSKFGFINGPMRYKYARHRQESYLNFLRENGLQRNDDWMLQLSSVDLSISSAVIMQMLSRENPPDAIFAASDVFAAVAIKTAKAIGLNVPGDLMVVGFDNIDMATISDPAITTISQPKFQLGYVACNLLADQINNPSAEPQRVILETELIVRGSKTNQQYQGTEENAVALAQNA